MRKNKVYIIILNYNGFSDTVNCIKSIQKSIYKEYQIILVDNNSDDNSLNEIIKYLDSSNLEYNFSDVFFADNNKQTKKDIVIIKNNENLGYASGNNVGMRYALQYEDCDFLWILNNDNIIEEKSLMKLVENHDKNTIYGSKILKYKNPELVDSIGGKLNYYLLTTSHNFSNTLNSELIKKVDSLDYIHGTSVFFHKDIINSIGYFDEDYFMYYEDVDWSIKAFRKGIQLKIVNDSIVRHYKNKYVPLKLRFYSFKNRLLFIYKNYPLFFPIQIILIPIYIIKKLY